MKKPILLLTLLTSQLWAAPDTVDQSFAATAGSYYDEVQLGGPASMFIQPDGKLLVGSNWMSAQNGALFTPLVRFNLDGTTDNTFHADATPNGQGSGIFYDLPGQPEVHGLAMQSDGKIIAVGCMQGMRDGVTTGSSTKALISNGIVRITPTGDPDITFQSAGIDTEFIDEVIVTSNDKIIIAGGFNAIRNQGGGFVTRYGIARLNTDGSLDTSFQVTPASFGNIVENTLFIRQVAPTANGQYYIVGNAQPVGGTFYDSVPIFARINNDGSLDASFAPAYPAGVDSFYGVVLESSGKVVALGNYGNTTSSTSYMGRFTNTGSPDNSLSLPSSLPQVAARPLRVDPLGRYILFKRHPVDGNSTLVRLNSDGSIDPTFNASGISTLDPQNTRPAYFNQAITSPTGKIYAGGGFTSVNGEDTTKIVAFEGDYVPNSPGTIQLAYFAASANEDDGTMEIPVIRIGGSSGAASVDYSFSDLNATAGDDYNATGGTITFSAGEAGTKFISVPLVDDSLVETLEVFSVTLSNATGASLGSLTSGNGTIIDSDSPPLIIAQPMPIYAPPFDAFQIAVGALSGKEPTTYQWFKDGVAISGATSPLYFVASADAATHDGDYTVTVTNPNGSVTSNIATVVVKDPAVLAFAGSTLQAIESDGSVSVTLTRGGSGTNAVSVEVTAQSGTATSPADYSFSTQTVSWADGDTADKTVTFSIANDPIPEARENFTLSLGTLSPDAELGGVSQTTITILDDDSLPEITAIPEPVLISTGQTLTLAVTSDSQTPATYQWFKDGVAVPDQTAETLSIPGVDFSEAGSYTVEITNVAGSVISGGIPVQVLPSDLLISSVVADPTSGTIVALAPAPNGKVYVGGAFTSIGGETIGKLALVNIDGTADPSFSPAFTTQDYVQHIRVTSSGDLIVAGFAYSAGNPLSNRLTKVSASGVIDATFSANVGAALNQNITDIEIGADGSIYVIGNFTGKIKKFSPTGVLDTSFAPSFPLISGNYFTLDSLEIIGNDLYVGGSFNDYSDPNSVAWFAKLDSTGAFDSAFAPTLSSAASNLEEDSNGALIFREYLGGFPGYRYQRISPAGVLDTSFSIPDDGSTKLLPLADGTYITARQGVLARYANDGSEIPDLRAAAGSSFTGLNDIELASDGFIWAAGPKRFNGVETNDLVRLTLPANGVLFPNGPFDTVVNETEDAQIFAPASGTSFITSYQWYFNGSPISDGSDYEGTNTSTLTIKNSEQGDEGNYTVTATNAAGQSATSDPALLTVLGLPEVAWTTGNPVSSLEGASITIEGTLAGSPSTTWEIFHEGSSVASGTQTEQTGIISHILSNVTVGQTGSYTIVASNSFGTTTSDVLFLDIRQNPSAVAADFTGTVNTFSGTVQDIAPTTDGGAYLAGNWYSWNFAGPTYTNSLARVDAAGQRVTSFAPTLSQNNYHAASILELTDGRVVFAAAGISFDGATNQEVVAMDEFGSRDTAFTSNLGTGPNGAVRDLAKDTDGKILLAGAFTSINGNPAQTLARLNPNGSLDTGFTPALSGTVATRVEVASDGSIYLNLDSKLRKVSAAGVLDNAFALDLSGSEPTILDFVPDGQGGILVAISNQGVHRFLSNGQRDLNYDPAPSVSLTSSLFARLTIDNEGKALVLRARAVNRLLDDGTLDPAYTPIPSLGNATATIAVSLQGPIWVGGYFTSPRYRYVKYAGTPAAVGIVTEPLPQIVEPGSTAAFTVETISTGPLSYQWFRNGSPLSDDAKYSGTTTATLTVNNTSDADEGLFSVEVTNIFSSDSKTSTTAPLTVLGAPEFIIDPLDTIVLEGDALVLTATAQAAGPFTVQWQKDGVDLVDGGSIGGATTFTLTIDPSQASDSGDYTVVVTNGLGTATSAVAKAQAVPNPAALTAGFVPPVFNNTVRAILPLPNGQTLVGGDFTSVNDNGVTKSRSRLALVNNDGSIDDNFTLATNSTVYDLFLDSNDRILVGGSFTLLGGATARRHARLNTDLTIDLSYAPSGSANSTVYAVAEDSNGDVWIAGQFSSSGSTPNQPYLAKFDSSGAPVPHIAAVNSVVYDLIPTNDGNLLLCGSFTLLGGNSISRMAKIDPAGALVTSYDTAGWSYLQAVAESPFGLVYAGGFDGSKFTIAGFNSDGSARGTFSLDSTITSLNSTNALLVQENERLLFANDGQPYFARLQPSGGLDPLFQQGTGANSTVNALALENDGSIWVGGNFSSYDGTPVGRLLRLQGDLVDLAIRQQPADTVADIGTSVTFTTFAETLDNDPIGYQWRKDGVAIPGATSASFTIATLTEGDEGLYDVVVTNLTTTTEKTSRAGALTVLSTPEITAQPTALNLEQGESLLLTVEARGAGTLGYQWQKDGSDIQGATSSNYEISSSLVADSGTYRVVITNNLGSITSADTLVSVILAPAARVAAWPNPAFNSTLRTILPLPDGRTLVGGNFSQANPGTGAQTIRYLALLDSSGNFDPSFNANPNNTVLDLALDGQGRVLVVGNFTSFLGQSRNRVARLNPDLTLDTSFEVGVGPNSTVDSVSALPDGSLYIGGEFTTVAGHATSYLARLDESGAVDTDFVSSTNSSVYDIVAEPTGKVSAVGRFTSSGRNYFFRMNEDGSIDETFAAGGTNNWLNHIELLGDGSYLVAGRSGQVRRYSAAGVLDSSFSPPVINSDVNALAVEQDGQIVIAGSFSTVGGNSSPYLARLNADGTIDSSFDVKEGASTTVLALALQPLGRIWVGGSFTTYRGNSNPYLEFLNGDKLDLGIARQPGSLSADLNSTATLTVEALASDGEGLSYQWRKNGVDLAGETASTLTFTNLQESDEADYDVIITNTTTLATVTSRTASLNVLSVPEILVLTSDQTLESRQALELEVEAEGAGALAYQWKKDGADIAGATSPVFTIPNTIPSDSAVYTVVISNALSTVTSSPITVSVSLPPAGIEANFPNYTFSGTVRDFLPLPDGRTLVAGQFYSIQDPVNGNTVISYLALFNADRSIDSSFNLTVNNTVNSLSLTGDGGVLLAGSFTTISGQARNRHALLLPDLTLAPSFGTNANPNNTVEDIIPAPDGGAILAGNFNQVNNDSSYGYLCHLKANGELDERYQPGVNSTVYALLPDEDGVIAGGSFTNPKNFIARFDRYGNYDSSYDGAATQQVYALARAQDGSYYSAGRFGNLRRFTSSGQWDNTFAVNINSNVWSLAVEPDGKVLLGGDFTTVAGTSRFRIARIQSDGSLDLTFDPGTGANNTVFTINPEALGAIWIGGSFSTYRGETIGQVAYLNGNPLSLGIAQQPANQVADFASSVTFSVVAQSADSAPISYQWRKDGTPITGETTATLTLSNLSLADEAAYDVVVTNDTTNDEVTSNSAQLQVLADPEILFLTSSLDREIGQELLLEVEAEGAGVLNYQWYKNNSPISGATASSYTLPSLVVADSGNYTVTVTNSLSTITSDVIELNVSIPPAGVFPGGNAVAFNSTVYDSLELPNGQILVAGQFSSVTYDGSTHGRQRLALLNSDGTFDASFALAANNTVRDLEIDSQGRVILAGDFTTIDGQSRIRHARLNSDLTLDPTFGASDGPNSSIYCVEVDSNDRVYLGGAFNYWSDTANSGSQTSGSYLVRLNADGSYDAGFNDSVNHYVYDLEVQADGKVLVGGRFSSPSYYFTRLESDGSKDASFTGSASNWIYAIAELPNGNLIAAGRANTNRLYDSSGAILSSFTMNSNVEDLAVDADGKLLYGGSFSVIQGSPSAYLARLESDGTYDASFDVGAGANSTIYSVTPLSSGRIAIGGSFTSYRGLSASYFTILNGTPPLDDFATYLTNFNLPANELGENDDPDGDGFPNLLEFIYSTDPSTGPSPEVVADTGTSTGDDLSTAYPTLGFVAGEQYQTFTVLVPKDLQGTTLEVETSTNLQNFGDGTINAVFLESTSFNALYDIRTYAYDQPLSVAPTAYARVVGSR